MKKAILIIFAIIFLSHYNVNGQTKAEIEHLKKIYSGTWVNKKEKRYLQFFFDEEAGYITVNDWTGTWKKNKSETLEAYKAFIKGDKLILYAENSDHHSPYCEMEVIDQKLVYRCNVGMNFKDQFLDRKKKIDKTEYKRLTKIKL